MNQNGYICGAPGLYTYIFIYEDISCFTSIIVSEKKSKFREHVAYYIYITKPITLYFKSLNNYFKMLSITESLPIINIGARLSSSSVLFINQRQPISSNLMIIQQINLSEVVTWPCRLSKEFKATLLYSHIGNHSMALNLSKIGSLDLKVVKESLNHFHKKRVS